MALSLRSPRSRLMVNTTEDGARRLVPVAAIDALLNDGEK